MGHCMRQRALASVLTLAFSLVLVWLLTHCFPIHSAARQPGLALFCLWLAWAHNVVMIAIKSPMSRARNLGRCSLIPLPHALMTLATDQPCALHQLIRCSVCVS